MLGKVTRIGTIHRPRLILYIIVATPFGLKSKLRVVYITDNVPSCEVYSATVLIRIQIARY